MAIKTDKAIKISQKHLLGIQDLSISDVNLILDEAHSFIKVNQSKNKKIDVLSWPSDFSYIAKDIFDDVLDITGDDDPDVPSEEDPPLIPAPKGFESDCSVLDEPTILFLNTNILLDLRFVNLHLAFDHSCKLLFHELRCTYVLAPECRQCQ